MRTKFHTRDVRICFAYFSGVFFYSVSRCSKHEPGGVNGNLRDLRSYCGSRRNRRREIRRKMKSDSPTETTDASIHTRYVRVENDTRVSSTTSSERALDGCGPSVTRTRITANGVRFIASFWLAGNLCPTTLHADCSRRSGARNANGFR